jgi:hypothetical protein
MDAVSNARDRPRSRSVPGRHPTIMDLWSASWDRYAFEVRLMARVSARCIVQSIPVRDVRWNLVFAA